MLFGLALGFLFVWFLDPSHVVPWPFTPPATPTQQNSNLL